VNRVHDKPYVVVEESNDIPDEEVATKFWKNHLGRNDSIVTDLFHGEIATIPFFSFLVFLFLSFHTPLSP
jgi:hypothetical protein